MILSADAIRRIMPVTPFNERGVFNGKSYGLSVAGYDVRIAQSLHLLHGGFSLASTIEKFNMPKNVLGLVKNKSSWARQGLNIFETVIEPGWNGYLTIEMFNCNKALDIMAGDPIAQILFFETNDETEGYSGKYQDQPNYPVEAIYEIE